VNGTISARGTSGHDANNCCGAVDGGAGSGGSLFVTCASIAGTGSIDVGGGNAGSNGGQHGGGGGGGRAVLITCTPGTIAHNEAGGAGGSGGSQAGTFVNMASPYIAIQPEASHQVLQCDANVQFSVRAFGTLTGLSYQWQVLNVVSGFQVWQNVANGAGTGDLAGLTVSGALTSAITLTPTPNFPASLSGKHFRCRVTPLASCGPNSTGGLASGEGLVTGIIPCCPADLDDGSGLGVRDGGVTIEDLIYFLAKFDAGLLAADLDDGSMTGTRDGAVTVEDLLYFLAHYTAGC